MANWVNLGNISGTPRFCCADKTNGKIAWGIASGSYSVTDVLVYDTGTYTTTTVLTFASHPTFSSIQGLTYFKGDLFALVKTQYTMKIYEYDGTPDSWTSVLTISSYGSQYAIDHGRLWSTDDFAFAYVVGDSYYGALDRIGIKGLIGGWWANSAGTKVFNSGAAAGLTRLNFGHNYGNYIYHSFAKTNGPATYSIIRGSVSGAIQIVYPDWYGFKETWVNDAAHWVNSYGYYTDNAWASQTSTGGDVGQIWSWGCPWSLGIGNDYKIYYWDNSEKIWVELDDPSGTHSYYDNNAAIICLDSGWPYFIGNDGNEGSYVIAARDEPFFSAAAELHYGINSISKTADLPFNAVEPGGLLLNTQSMIYVGRGATISRPTTNFIIRTQDDNYDSFDDLSTGHGGYTGSIKDIAKTA